MLLPKKGPAAAVLSQKVEIIWLVHTGRADLLHSCNRVS